MLATSDIRREFMSLDYSDYYRYEIDMPNRFKHYLIIDDLYNAVECLKKCSLECIGTRQYCPTPSAEVLIAPVMYLLPTLFGGEDTASITLLDLPSAVVRDADKYASTCRETDYSVLSNWNRLELTEKANEIVDTIGKLITSGQPGIDKYYILSDMHVGPERQIPPGIHLANYLYAKYHHIHGIKWAALSKDPNKRMLPGAFEIFVKQDIRDSFEEYRILPAHVSNWLLDRTPSIDWILWDGREKYFASVPPHGEPWHDQKMNSPAESVRIRIMLLHMLGQDRLPERWLDGEYRIINSLYQLLKGLTGECSYAFGGERAFTLAGVLFLLGIAHTRLFHTAPDWFINQDFSIGTGYCIASKDDAEPRSIVGELYKLFSALVLNNDTGLRNIIGVEINSINGTVEIKLDFPAEPLIRRLEDGEKHNVSGPIIRLNEMFKDSERNIAVKPFGSDKTLICIRGQEQ